MDLGKEGEMSEQIVIRLNKKSIPFLFCAFLFLFALSIGVQTYINSQPSQWGLEYQNWLQQEYGVSSIEELSLKYEQEVSNQIDMETWAFNGPSGGTSTWIPVIPVESPKIDIPNNEASFIIWTDGTKVYAAKGSDGSLYTSGTDACTVIQAAINALTSGGKIFIKRGTYTLSTVVELLSNRPWSPYPNAFLVIEGEGQSTLLKAADGFSANALLRLNNVERALVRDLAFDGNKAGGTTIREGLVSILYARHNTVENCYFLNSPAISICLDTEVYQCLISNNVVRDGSSTGIWLYGNSNQNVVTGNAVQGCSIGIMSQSSSRNSYLGNTVEGGTFGIRNYESYREIYIGNIIIEPTDSCFYADHCDYSVLANNIFKGKVGTTHRGIRIWQPKQVTIIGNVFDDFTLTGFDDRGIWLWGESDSYVGSQVFFNKFINTAQPFVGSLTVDSVKYNIGYVTEKSGTATFSGTGAQTTFTIAHGLNGTPKMAVVTAGSSGAKGDFYVTYDATYITVTYATAPPSGTNNVILRWYAEM